VSRVLAALAFAATWSGGCADPAEKFGRTWYIDGAGNWGFGLVDVPAGLKRAGYRGVVSNHRWSLTLNPALDQTLRFIARGSGAVLGAEISDYLRRNPGADANIIALSAGTGVAIWAAESIEPPHMMNSIALVGSSLSSRYDVSKALKHMRGNIYCYYASSDPVLQGPVRLLGTIDGSFDDSAGLVGLRGRAAASGRVVNIGWSSRYVPLGWTGGHADCTNWKFVNGEIARRLLPPSPGIGAPQTPRQADADAAGQRDSALAAADRDQGPAPSPPAGAIISP
jgi:hypothetical protein